MFIPERPEDAKFRTLIVLLDGTGDSVDDDVQFIYTCVLFSVLTDHPSAGD